MGAIFQSLGRTIIAGVVILLVIAGIAGTFGKMGDHAWAAFFMRYLHVLSGVMWIGLLWYFNFVQIPSMPKIPDEQKPAIGKVIAPDRAVLVPLGGAGDGRHRPAARDDEQVHRRAARAAGAVHGDRHRHVARH